MHFVRIASTAAAFLFLWTFAPANAREGDDKDKHGKPAKHQDKQDKQDKQNQGQQRGYKSPAHYHQGQATVWQQQQGWRQQGAWQGSKSWQRSRASQWDREHRSWVQRGGYGGHYIPQASFNLNFGNQNWFRMQGRPTMYMGYPRFAHGGYSFLLVDPWPEYWQQNWYENDEVYVDYDDGYYLHNRRHPGVKLAIAVAM